MPTPTPVLPFRQEYALPSLTRIRLRALKSPKNATKQSNFQLAPSLPCEQLASLHRGAVGQFLVARGEVLAEQRRDIYQLTANCSGGP